MPLKRQTPNVGPDRAMSAPYNFVPLPEGVYLPQDEVPAALSFDPTLLSGTITYELRTLTPTYTRAASTQGGREAFTSAFYHHGDEKVPVLPGSTMRGLIRSMVGQLGDAHLPRTKRNRFLFYRSFGSDALARVYGARFIEKLPGTRGPAGVLQAFRGRSEPGFLVQKDGQWRIQPAWALRVGHRLIGRDTYQPPPGRSRSDGRPINIPNQQLQHRPAWFRVDAGTLEPSWIHHKAQTGGGMYTWGRYVDKFTLERPAETDGWFSGWVVITGPMNSKRSEYVFAVRKDVPGPADAWVVPNELVDQVNDEQDQISAWQEDAFPATGKFAGHGAVAREAGGPPGLPIWFLRDAEGRIAGLGRAAYFRLRYDRTIDANIPASLRYPEEDEPSMPLDLVDRLFGYVRQPTGGAESTQLRGRLRFHDAPCKPGGTASPFLGRLPNSSSTDRIPHILSSPKPTAYQMYLVQSQTEKLGLDHFGIDGAIIRGTKNYWHKTEPGAGGEPKPIPEAEMFRQDRADRPGSQETIIRPVKPGVTFTGSVAFENLTPVELGALLAAIDLPEHMAHKLGMGKPLGMGSVRIDAVKVSLIDRLGWYSSWGARREIDEKETERRVEEARNAFRRVMVEHARRAYGISVPDGTSVWELPRQATLGIVLSWTAPPPSRRTRNISVSTAEGRAWRERLVLPAPHTVADAPDPYAQVPRAAASAPTPSAPTSTRPTGGPANAPRGGGQAGGPRPGPGGPPRPGQKRPPDLPENPDTFPDGARATAKITGGGPGSWRATLVDGRKVWNLKGSPPPGVRPKLEDVVNVRINRGRSEEYLTFDQSTR